MTNIKYLLSIREGFISKEKIINKIISLDFAQGDIIINDITSIDNFNLYSLLSIMKIIYNIID